MSEMQSPLPGDVPSYGVPHVQDQTPPAEPARLGPLQRLMGVIFSPGATFEDVNRKPTLIAPILIVIIVAASGAAFFNWRVHPDWNRLIRTQIQKSVEKSGQSLTEDQIQARVKIGTTLANLSPLLAAVFIPIFYLILSGIFALGMMFIQAKATFKKIFSVVAWSGVAVGLVNGIVSIAALMVQDQETLSNFDPTQGGSLLPTNLGAFLPANASGIVQALAGSIDIFTIWNMVLLSIGLAAIAGVRKITAKNTGMMVFGFWAVWVLVKVAWRAITG